MPGWVTLVHVFFMGWTILTAHYAPLFMLGMLFFLGFAQVKKHFDNGVSAAGLLRAAIVPTVIVFAIFLVTR